MVVNVREAGGQDLVAHLRRLATKHSANALLFHLRHLPNDDELIFEVNFKREMLFRQLHATVVFWADDRTETLFQRFAPDFWGWLVYRFRFVADTAMPSDADDGSRARPLPSIGEAYEARLQRLREREKLMRSQRDNGGRDTLDYAQVLLELASTYDRLANPAKARSLYEAAIGLFPKEQDPGGLINSYLSLAELNLKHDPVGSRDWYDKTLQTARSTQVPYYIEHVENQGKDWFAE